MKTELTRKPWKNLLLWLTFILIFAVFFTYIFFIVEDLLQPESNYPISGIYVLWLFFMYMIILHEWRKGMFTEQDFHELLKSLGAAGAIKPSTQAVALGAVRVSGKISHPFFRSWPWPRWHRLPVRRRPCGHAGCVLCNTQITIEYPDSRRSHRGVPEMRKFVVVGGSWEGMVFHDRLRAAIEAAQAGRELVS